MESPFALHFQPGMRAQQRSYLGTVHPDVAEMAAACEPPTIDSWIKCCCCRRNRGRYITTRQAPEQSFSGLQEWNRDWCVQIS